MSSLRQVETKKRRFSDCQFQFCSQPLKPDFPDSRELGTDSKKLPTKGQSPGDFLGHKIKLYFSVTIVGTRAQKYAAVFQKFYRYVRTLLASSE